MSSSSEMRTAEKAPSFTQTCSMLYQYLKEKGQVGDLNLVDMQFPHVNNGSGEIFRQRAQQQQQPMKFFPVMEKPRNVPAAPRGFKSRDLFPQQAGFGSSLPKMSDFLGDFSTVKKTLPQKAQMTIFYGGQVVVFDDFPAEKAKEVMLLASKESSKSHQMAQVSAPVKTNTTTIFGTQFGKAPINSGTAPVVPPSSNSFPNQFGKAPINSDTAAVVPPSSNSFPKFGNQVIQQQEAIKPTPTRPVITDIPMQRKASLQRFLAKRKDRMNNLAPYQMSIAGLSAPSKPAADGKSWLGLAALPTQ
ncbi:hypothetical protein ACLB2K_000779 [Fragaria x ananassa]